MIYNNRSAALVVVLSCVLVACVGGSRTLSVASTVMDVEPWAHGGMVSAANPHAAEAAANILRAGGHAVDAAIAAHAVLGLVEPQSSGLGGGAFMLVYDRASGVITVYDGRETAPAGATADMFLIDGEVMGFLDAWQSGLAVGVPGTVALYKAAHDGHGRRPWGEVLQPAIALAEKGFAVSPRLNYFLNRMTKYSRLDDNPASAAYFYPGGEALPVGFVRDNPEYAHTLRRVANEGPDAFYKGELPAAMVAAVQAAPLGGTLSIEDIANYLVEVREPVCGPFRHFTLCVAPPPSSGIAQITIAGLYDRLTSRGASQDQRLRNFVDAQRLAYADRDHYVADPAFAPVPVRDLISPAYLDARAKQRIAPDGASAPGDPGLVMRGEAIAHRWGPDTTNEASGTTHLSVIDRQGNAVSMTATVEAPFGSSRWVGGFLLNNEMTDFARDPNENGKLSANVVAPGKRPRSSMSPTLIFDNKGELFMVTGSPGGNSIVAYVAKTTLGVLAWGETAQSAIELPNIVARGDTVRVETAEPAGLQIAEMLRASGYEVQEREGENSGLHVIVVRDAFLEGGADPRREGIVIEVSAAP